MSRGRWGCNFKFLFFKLEDRYLKYFLRNCPHMNDIGLHDKSKLVQVMAWCHKATNDYLSHCWFRYLLPHGITRPQLIALKWWHNTTYIWVNIASCYGLLSDCNKPLPEPILTCHQYGPVSFMWGQFYKKCSDWNILFLSNLDTHLKITNLKLQTHFPWFHSLALWNVYSHWMQNFQTNFSIE